MTESFEISEIFQRRPALKWIAFVAIWTALGVFFASHSYIKNMNLKIPLPWGEAIVLGLVEWYLWGGVSLLVYRFCRRIVYTGRNWLWLTGIHFIIGATLSLLIMAIYTALEIPLDNWFMRNIPEWEPTTDFALVYIYYFKTKFTAFFLTYSVIVVVAYGIQVYRRYRQEELSASELRAQLAGAQLQALRAQLHPHFLFNTLHAISSLMRSDVEAADKMITRLSDLLRLALRSGTEQKVSLRRELEFIEKYLEIEKVRFSDRLRTELVIESRAFDAVVASLLLQPLVENAIRHGIAQSTSGGVVRITALCRDDQLVLSVENACPAAAMRLPVPQSQGVGLANTRERLLRLYPERHQFLVENSEGMFVVKITIPFELVVPDSFGGS